MHITNHYGSLPTGVRDEFHAGSMWRIARKQINRSTALIRPMSPLEDKAKRAFTTASGPPLPVTRSTIKFDKLHHGQARRGKLALKQLEDEPTNVEKQAAFRHTIADLARTRFFIDAKVERGGASVYPDQVWGIPPERLQSSAPKAGRLAPTSDVTSGLEFTVSYNRHRGSNIKSQLLRMPSPRRSKMRINIHKLLPDSHFALGAFHIDI